jgi:hypothetical protein
MIALISRDAGGAEFISRYASNQKEKFCLAATGPAIKIFKKKFRNKKILDYKKAIRISDWALCSTGTSTDYEKNAIIFAKKNNKKIIAYIDHWVEYRERFLKNKKLIRPDEIWVSDKYALDIAKKNNLRNITIKENPLFNDFLKYKKKFNRKNCNGNILFLSEPVSKDLKNYYDETECIRYFLKNLNISKLKYKNIQIRPHPAESVSKFIKLKKISKKIFISNKNNIFHDIMKSNIIVGINTIALVLGLLANKKVISCIPGKKNCELPHKKILNYRNLINEKKI